MATSPQEHTLQSQIEELGPWFHNLHFPDGTQTAPNHVLGDFPRKKWKAIEPYIPGDLRGRTVLDVGCNAGFYSFELARRGAQVTAIDLDSQYLDQARFAAEVFGLSDRITFKQQQIYDLAADDERYDIVWFMGVFYHLRYPMLGLDIIARKVKELMVFQTMTVPGDEMTVPPDNLSLEDRQQMNDPGWPKMCFIERRLADDPTNWWAANKAGVEAMLRSAGLRVTERPAHEIYLCERGDARDDGLDRLLEEEFLAATGLGRT